MPTGSKNMEAAWQSHEGTIRDLYFAKNMTLVEVMAHMKQNYGFDARFGSHDLPPCLGLTSFNSKGQYESRFRKWNLRKHLKGSEWKYVSRRVQKRKKEGKESAVYFNRVAIAAEKVRKETSRHDVPTYRSGISNRPPEISGQSIEGCLQHQPRRLPMTSQSARRRRQRRLLLQVHTLRLQSPDTHRPCHLMLS